MSHLNLIATLSQHRKVGPRGVSGGTPLAEMGGPLYGKEDPCYSHIRRPKDLGWVSEAYHEVVPGITLDNMWRNCGKMNEPPRLIAAKKSRGLSHGETLLQLIVDVGPGRVLDHLGPRCFAIGAIRYNMACATKVNHQLQPGFDPSGFCLDAISALGVVKTHGHGLPKCEMR